LPCIDSLQASLSRPVAVLSDGAGRCSACLNEHMAQSSMPPRSVSFRAIADVGTQPLVSDVTDYLTSMANLWTVFSRPDETENWQNRRTEFPLSTLTVRHLRMQSPLEVIFTQALESAPTLGYAAGVWLAFERAVKMLMDWQNHRQDLMERMTRLRIEVNNGSFPTENFDADSNEIERATRQIAGVFRLDPRAKVSGLPLALRRLVRFRIVKLEAVHDRADETGEHDSGEP
jgi:hypothetical protein